MTQSQHKSNPQQEHVWEQGWDGHEQLQQERMARMTMAEKLEWLEEAHRVVMQMQAKQGSREAFDKVLDKVPNIPPVKGDELQ